MLAKRGYHAMERWVRHTVAALLLASVGCSTAPVADLLDYFAPAKIGTDRVPPYGGVCNPVGPPTPGPVTPPPPIVTPINPPPSPITPPSPPPAILPPAAPAPGAP